MTQKRGARRRRADTEVFYMAGQQLPTLSRCLLDAGWPAETTVSVVSRAGWPDQLVSEHDVGTLATACAMHAGRPAVVTVGVGAGPVTAAEESTENDAHPLEGHQASTVPRA
jgi:uroporphyrin-III C-methyltransferase